MKIPLELHIDKFNFLTFNIEDEAERNICDAFNVVTQVSFNSNGEIEFIHDNEYHRSTYSFYKRFNLSHNYFNMGYYGRSDVLEKILRFKVNDVWILHNLIVQSPRTPEFINLRLNLTKELAEKYDLL